MFLSSCLRLMPKTKQQKSSSVLRCLLFQGKIIAEKEVNLPPSMNTVYQTLNMWPSRKGWPHKLCRKVDTAYSPELDCKLFFEENKETSTRHFIHSTFNDPDWQIPNKSILNIIKLLKQRRLYCKNVTPSNQQSYRWLPLGCFILHFFFNFERDV
jgi:hypothetical protein